MIFYTKTSSKSPTAVLVWRSQQALGESLVYNIVNLIFCVDNFRVD